MKDCEVLNARKEILLHFCIYSEKWYILNEDIHVNVLIQDFICVYKVYQYFNIIKYLINIAKYNMHIYIYAESQPYVSIALWKHKKLNSGK